MTVRSFFRSLSLCFVPFVLSSSVFASSVVKIDTNQWNAITQGAGYGTKGIQFNVQAIVDHMKTWDNILGPMQTSLNTIANKSTSIDSALAQTRTYIKGINDLLLGPGGFRQLVDDVRYIRNNSSGGSSPSKDYTHFLQLLTDSNQDIRLKTIAISSDVSSLNAALYSGDLSVADLLDSIWNELYDDLSGTAIDNGLARPATIGSLVSDLRNALANKIDNEIRENVSEDTNAYKDHFSTKPNKDNIGGMSGLSDGASDWFSTDVTIADAGGMFNQFDQNLASWFSGTTASQISVGGADAASDRSYSFYVAPDTPNLDAWMDEAHGIVGELNG